MSLKWEWRRAKPGTGPSLGRAKVPGGWFVWIDYTLEDSDGEDKSASSAESVG